MLLIFRIEKFHGDQFWMNCYFTIYLTIEPNRMRISIATAFFFPVFVLRFNKHHTFHHKFIFCIIFFFLRKVNDSPFHRDDWCCFPTIFNTFRSEKKNHNDKRTEKPIKMHTTTGEMHLRVAFIARALFSEWQCNLNRMRHGF